MLKVEKDIECNLITKFYCILNGKYVYRSHFAQRVICDINDIALFFITIVFPLLIKSHA